MSHLRALRALCKHPDRRIVERRSPHPYRKVDWRCPDCGLRWTADPRPETEGAEP